jgi:uncharacterized RDD family membrane protein YckC
VNLPEPARADAPRPTGEKPPKSASSRGKSGRRRRKRKYSPQQLLWPRFWARQIDASFCLAAGITVMAALGVAPPIKGNEALIAWLYWPPLIGLLQLVYEAVSLTLLGTTVGKAIMGLRVRTQFGRRIEFARACGRSGGVWLKGSFAYVFFPALTFIAWTSAANALKKRGSTSWDTSWETDVVGAPLSAWRLGTGAALALIVAGVLLVPQISGLGKRDTLLASANLSSRPIKAADGAATTAATAASEAGSSGGLPFPIATPPGRPDMNRSVEELALWAERAYPFFVKDGPARRALFAWMIEGSRAGLQRNHALALGIDTVVSGLESGHGLCWPVARPPDSSTPSTGKPTMGIRCER